MKPFVIVALLLLTGLNSACDKSYSQLCGGDDPDKTLPWLKAEIQRLSSLASCNTISRSTFKNQTVFILSNCDPNVDSMPLLYDCEGNQLDLSAEDYQNLNFTGDIELIWKNK